MKKKICNTILGAAFAGCVILAAVTDGMLALLPLFAAVCAAIALLDINTDWIWNE